MWIHRIKCLLGFHRYIPRKIVHVEEKFMVCLDCGKLIEVNEN